MSFPAAGALTIVAMSLVSTMILNVPSDELDVARRNEVVIGKKCTITFGDNVLYIVQSEQKTTNSSSLTSKHDYAFYIPFKNFKSTTLVLDEHNVSVIGDCSLLFTQKLPMPLSNMESFGLLSKVRIFDRLNDSLRSIGCGEEKVKELVCTLNGDCSVAEQHLDAIKYANLNKELNAIRNRLTVLEQKVTENGTRRSKSQDEKINIMLETVLHLANAFDKISYEFSKIDASHFYNESNYPKVTQPSKIDKSNRIAGSTLEPTAATTETQQTGDHYPSISNCSVDVEEYFGSLRVSREHNVPNAFYIESTSTPTELIVVSQGDSELLTLMKDGEIVGFRVLATKAGNMAHDSSGRFYITDSAKGWIAILDSNLRVIRYLPEKLQNPIAVAVNEDKVFVSLYGRKYISVLKRSGQAVKNISTKDTIISDIFIGKDGLIYASGRQGIIRFDLDGHAFDGSWYDSLSMPRQIYVDDAERLWIIDESQKELLVLSTYDGEIIGRLDLSQFTELPTGFALDSNCTLYVADQRKGKVTVLRSYEHEFL